tara:strand:+ start:569 stop:3004 length:2436 start_codon:yes stop_codon:yes gene_type:complete
MAHITLQGSLEDPNGSLSVGDQIRFTHNSTTGLTLKGAASVEIITPLGNYYIELQYGLVLVEYKPSKDNQFKRLGVATVNATNTATSIPELLNALVPVSSAELIEFQAILSNAVTAQTASETAASISEAFANQLTTTELIASTAIYSSNVTLISSGFTTSGDGGSGSWIQNGVTGQTPSQSPEQLAGALLNDGNGNQWSMILNNTADFNTTAEIEALTIGNVGQKIICRELDDSEYILQPPSYAPKEGDLTLANGLICQLQKDKIRSIATLSDLKLSPGLYDGEMVVMRKRYSGATTQTAHYKWISTSDAENNDDTVVLPLALSTGRWIKLNNNYFTKTTPAGQLHQKMNAKVDDKWFSSSVSLIGDSISWGSNSPDVYNDSYAGVLRKLCNIEFKSTNIGFISLRGTATNGVGTYNDFHTVTTSGSWSTVVDAQASTLINGYGRVSNSVGAFLDIAAPTSFISFRVFYRQHSSGGSFKVSTDGGATYQTTVNSSGTEDGSAATTVYYAEDNGAGATDIRIEIVSGSVTVCGMQYIDAFSDSLLNNFSEPGRKILHLDDSVIDDITTARSVVWELGFNDTGSSEAEKLIVIDKLKYLRQKLRDNYTKLYVVDTLWGKAPDNWLRSELAKLCSEVDGAVYISMPDLLTRGGLPISQSDLNTVYDFLSDGAHPTPFGHGLIAETVAAAMGFSMTSKLNAEMFSMNWIAIPLINGWGNTFTNPDVVTAYRRNGNEVQIKIALNSALSTDAVYSNLTLNGFKVSTNYSNVASRLGGSDNFVVEVGIGQNSSLSLYGGVNASTVYSTAVSVPITNF